MGTTGMLAAAMLLMQVVSPPPAPPAGAARAVVAAAGLGAWSADVTDAFRFTSVLAGGRGATIFEARRTPVGAERTIVALAPVQGGWEVQSRETRRLADETFRYIGSRVDTAIAQGAPTPEATCVRGPDYLSERLSQGAVRSLAGGCGQTHPNLSLAKLFGVVEDQ